MNTRTRNTQQRQHKRRLVTRLTQAQQAAREWPSTRAQDLICSIERQIRTLDKPVAVTR